MIVNIRKGFISFLALLLVSACASVEPVVPTTTPTLPATSTALPTETSVLAPLPTITSTSISSKPQTIFIYLVAVGDNGISGEMIGCGDSLVPVEVAIEPTEAVLRSALTALLNLSPEMTYGQSGLYNALYLSDLQIESLDIIDREAIISLTGTMVTGGECDIPRIEAQLTAIAMQFSTIDSVTITINGILLQDLLDLRG
ncbi:MAG: GerMN domain-containing protein [Anaerolineaceae bacterium]